MRETSLMTFFLLHDDFFPAKAPPSFPLHPPQSYPGAVSSLFSVSLGFDERCRLSAALSARRGKLIRDQINRAAPEEPGVSLPQLKGCPGWAGRHDVLPGKYTAFICCRSQTLPVRSWWGSAKNPCGFACLHRPRVWPLLQKNKCTVAAKKCPGGL